MINRCDLTIEFDEPSRRYKTGEEVTGFVTVDVNKDCRCSGLQVDCQWRTHGRGNQSTGSTATDNIFEGEWTAGGVHRYPFSFVIPNGPCSYHGHVLNVDWYIIARANIPWSFDPWEEADFLVEPGWNTAYEPYLTGDPTCSSNASLEHRVQVAQSGQLGTVIFGFIFLLVGVIAGLDIAFDDDSSVGGLIMALIFGSVGAASIFFGLRNRLATIKLGEIKVQIPQKRLRAGGIVEVLINIPPASRAHLNKITARLVATEVVISGVGTNKTTHTHTVYDDPPHTFEGSVDRELLEGESAHFSHRYRLPYDVPPSFHADENDLNWSIAFHVDIARWPDWMQYRPLEVLPADPRAREEEQAIDEDDWSEAPPLTEDAVW